MQPLILQDERLETELLDRVLGLIQNPKALSRMSRAMSALATPEAAHKIAALIYDMAGTPEREGKA